MYGNEANQEEIMPLSKLEKEVLCRNLLGAAPEPLTFPMPGGGDIIVGGENHLFRKAAQAIESLTSDLGGDPDGYISTVWRHEKSGGVYVIVGSCQLEATNEPAYLYKAVHTVDTAPIWARSCAEFLDGLFTQLVVYDAG